MNSSRNKFKRKPIKQHRELADPKYRARDEKHIKVRRREVEEKEAEEAIRSYDNDSGST